jgi:adenosylhomocysteine nucleosidase
MSRIHLRRTEGLIGIIGATRLEIGLLKKGMELIEEGRAENSRFFRGSLSGKELVLVESGIGYARATKACAQMIERFSPVAILSFGLAGSVDMNTRIGDILLATYLLRVEDTKTLEVQETYKLDEELLYNTSKILCKYDLEFKMGKVLTVPYFVFKLQERQRIGREIGVKAVDMEGAAIIAEARKHRIPVMALRLISDDMSTREINYAMVIGPTGKPTPKGGLRFLLFHGRDLLEVLRFGRKVRRLGARLSGIGTRIIEEITPLSTGQMDLQVLKKKIPCSRFYSKGMRTEGKMSNFKIQMSNNR